MNAGAATILPSADAHAPATPQLRTLLLTDLCDSTTLVERLGDAAAATLFRAHDALVLELQQRWRGRLIDRSDGLLLLFERPIDGLGFALDYTRGLRALGEAHTVPLQARAGLHVGEVLTWRNSDAAVAVGAKPLEVEGLAKPMAGRLMTLARPGQLLLSAVAEPLARRAARELGERGEHLLWKSWGRWRFKGVPEAQELYEVGEPGYAPLRAPKAGAKAWRDIPLWRRPAALAAEALLCLGLAGGAWFATRPEPAIAFNERDWVVVADLRNLTGDTLLDDSLEQAFRISLEQSRYVNVLSDLKARDTLALMQRPPGTALDRAVASEIALRDGARAVILPTVAEVGGKVRVSAEVIDPRTQTTVYAESADGTGAASALGSIDHVTAALRGKLGEALESIGKTSEPLPQVSTGNLDALRAYALGQKAFQRNDYANALPLYRRATDLDPQFALAWIGQAKVSFAILDMNATLVPLGRAEALRDRLAPRESAYLDGWSAEIEAPAKALAAWRLMADLYPDSMPAAANVAMHLLHDGRWQDALRYAERTTVRQSDNAAFGFDEAGRALMALGDTDKASDAFRRAYAGGNRASLQRLAEAAAVSRRFDDAERIASKISPADYNRYLERATFAVDQGRFAEARDQATKALRLVDAERNAEALSIRLQIAMTDELAGNTPAARLATIEVTRQALQRLAAGAHAEARELVGTALTAGLLAQQLGDRETARQLLAGLQGNPEMALPRHVELAVVLRAHDARLSGDPQQALALLAPLLTGHESFQTHLARMQALDAAGRHDEAAGEAQWLQVHRGLGYAEMTGYHCQAPWNAAISTLAHLERARLLALAGDKNGARDELAAFDRQWPVEGLPPYLRVRRAAVVPASS
ncbi:MAG: putative peptide modification system cyclase [Lysobacteraceae bacterium]